MLGIVQTVMISFSALYFLLIFLIFMFKKRIVNTESTLYRNLLIINLLTLITEIGLFFLSKLIFMKGPWDFGKIPVTEGVAPFKKFMFLMISKVFIALVLLWFVDVFKYTYYLCHKNALKKEKLKKYNSVLNIIYFVVACIILILPVEYIVTEESGMVSGAATNVAMPCIMLCLFGILFYVIKNFKKIEIKKTLPLIILIVLMVFAIFVQVLYPEILVFNPVITFITLFMYHTIENPALKIINELYRNKELVEQNYEDKYNFLFEITGEARKPLLDITKICNELKHEENPETIKNGLLVINTMVNQLNFTINNILDISVMDAHKIKFIDTKYDLAKFCNDIIMQIKNTVDTGIEIKASLPNQMPVLYGDYLKLRQILYSLIITPARDKRNTVIEFKLDLIERFDCCRVIFTITADKSEISIEDINNILRETGEYSQNDLYNLEKKELDMVLCQKVIKIMGGNLMIKSSKNGMEIKLVIDQKTYQEDNENLLSKYLDNFNDRQKVLIISQDKQISDDMKKYFTNNNYNVYRYLYGKDALDRLKAGKKFDYIFISDNMDKMSGLEVLKNLKEMRLDIPVIIMLNKNNENLGKHYIDEGFTNYLITDDLMNNLDKLLKR